MRPFSRRIFNWKRCVARTFASSGLLLVSERVVDPSFLPGVQVRRRHVQKGEQVARAVAKRGGRPEGGELRGARSRQR